MNAITLPSVAERVAAGAALLDQREPDWHQLITLHDLELADCHDCVLGQLFGDYIAAFDERALGDFGPGWTFGFATNAEEGDLATDAAIEAEYAALTAAWRELIETRREVNS